MEMRLKFNENPSNYEKYRPLYPDEMFKDIINYSAISLGSKALEIGIGTGQATTPILNTGCDVTAIELGENLAKYVGTKFKAYDNFNVINDDFMNYKVDNENFNLVYSATAFHWLPTEEALIKVKKVLKVNGVIALFWNHPFVSRMDDKSNIASRRIYDKYRPTDKKIVEFSEDDCKKYVDELEKAGFKDVKSKLYHRIRTLTTEEYIGLLNTYSEHPAPLSEQKNDFEREMREAINSVGGKVNIYDTIDLYLGRII